MTTYFVVIFIVLICCYLAQQFCVAQQSGEGIIRKRTQGTNIALFIAVAALTLPAGLRYWVGTDYGNYYILYQAYASKPFAEMSITDEPMISLIAKVGSFFSDSPFSMFFIASLITIAPALYSIYKETDDFIFATLLFVFTGCWHGSFNGVRQCLAVTIVFLGRHYITDKKFFKYLLVCFLAFLAHRSALFCVSFYFVYTEKFTGKRLFIITITTLILSRSYETIFNFIGWMNNEEIIHNSYSLQRVNILRTLVNCCPAIVGVYYAFTRKLDKQQIFYTYMMVICAAICIATADSAYLYRLSMYPAMFVPLGLSFISKSTSRKHHLVFRYLVIIFYFLFWIYEILNGDDLRNFQWAFGKTF